jgi:hypothetical protein
MLCIKHILTCERAKKYGALYSVPSHRGEKQVAEGFSNYLAQAKTFNLPRVSKGTQTQLRYVNIEKDNSHQVNYGNSDQHWYKTIGDMGV